MIGLLSLLIFGLLVFLGIGKLLANLHHSGNWNENYKRLGQRYGAKPSGNGVTPGWGLAHPPLRFNYGRTMVLLSNHLSLDFGGGPQTFLNMHWPNRRLKLEIAAPPNGRIVPGVHQVKLNQPKFESCFFVASNHPEQALKLLSSGTQWQLEQLRRLGSDFQLRVSIDRGQLVVTTPTYLTTYQTLDEFIRLGLDLFDQLMLTQAKGIEFLHEDEATIIDSVKCPICSETIRHNLVVCRRCQTPHCLDCWQYNGQCATFACNEIQFIHAPANDPKWNPKECSA